MICGIIAVEVDVDIDVDEIVSVAMWKFLGMQIAVMRSVECGASTYLLELIKFDRRILYH